MLTHKGTLTIETPRLILRKARIEDAEPMFRNWAGDSHVTTYLTWPAHQDVGVSQAVTDCWVRDGEKDTAYHWMIVLKELGEPIGSIGVTALDEGVEKAEIGYCIGRRWWGQGIMTEALKAVMDYLFDEIGMNRVEACHDPRNPASGAVMKKCGMTYEATLRQFGRNNQGICDVCFYALLKEERNAGEKI